ncbi:hypothetical protein EB796_011499 [Bugula neritina]|uniref:Uncharacterized protein n=1 Tax=Bugula neritina TaxID=10212 RepID=A0A7J7JXX9_BUGNE|nr:hypothetical protein EB796_011499 [Bugula neritina]
MKARRKWKKFVTMLVCRKSSSISLARIQHGEGLLCQACSSAKRVILLPQGSSEQAAVFSVMVTLRQSR